MRITRVVKISTITIAISTGVIASPALADTNTVTTTGTTATVPNTSAAHQAAFNTYLAAATRDQAISSAKTTEAATILTAHNTYLAAIGKAPVTK